MTAFWQILWTATLYGSLAAMLAVTAFILWGVCRDLGRTGKDKQ
jgi:hypothetical protein